MTIAQESEPPRPWGVWATIGFVLVAGIVAVIVTAAALVIAIPGGLDAMDQLDEDGLALAVVTIPSVIAEVAILALIARFRGWRPGDYLGFTWPSGREVAIAFAAVAALVVAYDAMTYALGKDVVSKFQTDVYVSARDGGVLVWMWIAVVLAAPFGEEVMFRGFVYRGFVRSQRDVIPAIIVIAGAWALLHNQYDWYGIVQIFVLGLALGWVRWRTGSTLLTFALHAATNAWATVQTIIKLYGS